MEKNEGLSAEVYDGIMPLFTYMKCHGWMKENIIVLDKTVPMQNVKEGSIFYL